LTKKEKAAQKVAQAEAEKEAAKHLAAARRESALAERAEMERQWAQDEAQRRKHEEEALWGSGGGNNLQGAGLVAGRNGDPLTFGQEALLEVLGSLQCSMGARDTMLAEDYDLDSLMVSSAEDLLEIGVPHEDAAKLARWAHES
jgi:hypothetical protein